MNVRSVFGLFLCSMLLVELSGCSGEQPGIKVSGNVTIDGQPLTGASVALFNREYGSGCTCELDETGQFHSATPIPVGNYLVTIVPLPSAHKPGDAGMPTIPKVPEIVPKKYLDANKTDATVYVNSDKTTLNIELKSK